MATQTGTGNQPRLVSDERLDLPDYNAGSTLIQATLLAALGGVIGPNASYLFPFGGCASLITTSWDGGTKFLSINGGLLYQGGTLASPSTGPSGRFIAYDPTSAAQVAAGTGIDLTAEAAGSTTCIIWATRTTTTSALELRKRWLPGATAESSFATNTRTVEIVTFYVTEATFNGSGQVTAVTAPPSSEYFPVFKITAWPAGVPTVGLISYWDGTNALGFVGDPNTKVDALGAPGIATMLYYLRQQLARLYDSTNGTSWLSFSGNGVSQINTALATAQTNITNLQNRTHNPVITSFTVSYDGVLWTFDQTPSDVKMSSVTRTGTGEFDFVIDNSIMVGAVFLGVNSVVVTLQGVTGAPTIVIAAVDITDPTAGEFTIRFYNTSGTLTDPDNDGFAVMVGGY